MGIQEMDIGGHKLTINESDNDLYDPLTGHTLTGSWVWSSSLFLSEWLVSQTRLHLFDLQGKTVLELGAGMGIPGLISARLGAGRVILTDAPPLLPGLQRNVDLNQDQVAGGGDRVEVRELVWGSDVVGELGEVDVVLMSDVFYDESEMESLAKTLKKVCGLKTKVWSATEIRPWTGGCLNKLVSEGFEVNEVVSQLGFDDHDDAPPLFAVFHIVLRVSESIRETEHAAAAMVESMDSQECVVAYRKFRSLSALESEILAVEIAMELGIERGFKSIIIQGDCREVMEEFQNINFQVLSSYITVTKHIQNLMSFFLC